VDAAESTPTRRRFLMGAAVAAAAAGTAATANHLAHAPIASASPPQAEPADDGATGYRLSEHIRKYYKTTWI